MLLLVALLVASALASHATSAAQPGMPHSAYLERPGKLKVILNQPDADFDEFYQNVFLINAFPEMGISMDEYSRWSADCKVNLKESLERMLADEKRFQFVYFLLSTFDLPQMESAIVALSDDSKERFGAVLAFYKFHCPAADAIPALLGSKLYKAIVHGPIQLLRTRLHIETFVATAKLALKLERQDHARALFANRHDAEIAHLYRYMIELNIDLCDEIYDLMPVADKVSRFFSGNNTLNNSDGLDEQNMHAVWLQNKNLNASIELDNGPTNFFLHLERKLNLLSLPSFYVLKAYYGQNFEKLLDQFVNMNSKSKIIDYLFRYKFSTMNASQLSAICFFLVKLDAVDKIVAVLSMYARGKNDKGLLDVVQTIWALDNDSLFVQFKTEKGLANKTYLWLIYSIAKTAGVVDYDNRVKHIYNNLKKTRDFTFANLIKVARTLELELKDVYPAYVLTDLGDKPTFEAKRQKRA